MSEEFFKNDGFKDFNELQLANIIEVFFTHDESNFDKSISVILDKPKNIS